MTVMQPRTAFAEAERPAPGGRAVGAALRFRRSGNKTFLVKQYTPHPFHITRPFYVDGDPDSMATLYLQSSSGGLYGDDDLLSRDRPGSRRRGARDFPGLHGGARRSGWLRPDVGGCLGG